MERNDPQSQDVDRFFTDFSARWSSLYGGERNAFWRWFDNKFRRDIYERYELTFDALGEDLRGKSVIDIGCGDGVYSFEAARRGASSVLGVDIAEGMISLCQKRSRELNLDDQTKFVCTEFPPPSPLVDPQQKYDIGIVMGVMDYVSDPVAFLQALREHVSGLVVISFPGKRWLRWQLRRWRYKLLGRCAIFHYHETDMRESCRKAGLHGLEITYLPHSGGCYFVRSRE